MMELPAIQETRNADNPYNSQLDLQYIALMHI